MKTVQGQIIEIITLFKINKLNYEGFFLSVLFFIKYLYSFKFSFLARKKKKDQLPTED